MRNPPPPRGACCGGFSVLERELQDVFFFGPRQAGGESGIRTHDTLLTYTRFPSVRLKPLGHLSAGARFYSSKRKGPPQRALHERSESQVPRVSRSPSSTG